MSAFRDALIQCLAESSVIEFLIKITDVISEYTTYDCYCEGDNIEHIDKMMRVKLADLAIKRLICCIDHYFESLSADGIDIMVVDVVNTNTKLDAPQRTETLMREVCNIIRDLKCGDYYFIGHSRKVIYINHCKLCEQHVAGVSEQVSLEVLKSTIALRGEIESRDIRLGGLKDLIHRIGCKTERLDYENIMLREKVKKLEHENRTLTNAKNLADSIVKIRENDLKYLMSSCAAAKNMGEAFEADFRLKWILNTYKVIEESTRYQQSLEETLAKMPTLNLDPNYYSPLIYRQLDQVFG